MAVGSFMGRVFTVSDSRIFTPSGLRGSSGSDWATHELIGISIPAFREEGDNKFQQEIAKTQGIKQPFLQTVTRNHSLSGKNPKVD